MGKRKERRLAAMMAASRRVKLDLFAEPSGEMVSSSLHDEVGGDLDRDHQAGGPTSPSSSAQKQENPLLLLGQYSEDYELDEEASKQSLHAVEGIPETEPTDQGHDGVDTGAVGGSKSDIDADGDIKQPLCQLDTVKDLDIIDAKESDATRVVTQDVPTDPAIQTVVDGSGMQIVGDLAEGWKVVMHEQSNQYYYWNTLTGETSWVMPGGLAVETGTLAGQSVASSIEGKLDYPVLHAHTHLDPIVVPYSNVSGTNEYALTDSVSGSMGPYGAAEIEKENGKHSSIVLEHNMLSNEAMPGGNSSGSYETTDVHSFQLVSFGQSLLERSKALKGLPNCPEGIEMIVKEIEIRISDCQALSSYGSSLLPFWWHVETHLKQLESAIVVAEASFVVEQHSLTREEHSLPHNLGAGPEVPESNSASVDAENHQIIPIADPTAVQAEAMEVLEIEDIKINGLASKSNTGHLEIEKVADVVPEVKSEVGTVQSISKVQLHTEDIDMDVEMEVDDEDVVGNATAPNLFVTKCPAAEQIIHPASSSKAISAEEHNLPPQPDIPPPPDEEWIPPPPPDSEPIPPPPPEDPPIPHPPLYTDSIPPPYQDQYNVGYSLPTYDYYAPAVGEVTSASYYVQSDGSHIAEPQQPTYYDPVVASAFPEVTADANVVESIAFYDTSNAAVTNGLKATSAGSSGLYVESVPINYPASVCDLDHQSSVRHAIEPESSIVQQAKHASHISAVAREPNKGIMQAASSSYMVQAAATSLINGDAMSGPSAVSKGQSKAMRTKKRAIAVAPTLRSNKKVSTLLDKWMAAKEELHGEEEEEPDDAYEILEKKRQKEIEEWHARQIASGEAQDNANFLPLGGDWRERVKRRRAETRSKIIEVPAESVENEMKQPDLAQLSKGLPSGWQAYWDDSTKEVYYGNSLTSETTWSRPTR